MSARGALWLALAWGTAAFGQDGEANCQRLNDTQKAREAAQCYERVAQAAARGTEPARRAWLRAARNHLWSGAGRRAAGSYQRYLQDAPEDREAILEYARLLRYRGDYGKAERLCDGLLARNPTDAEALALRAEILYWAGHRALAQMRDAEQTRSGIAQAAALEAQGRFSLARQRLAGLEAREASSDMARFLERKIEEQARPSSSPSYAVYNDSDGIHNSARRAFGSIPVRSDHSVSLSASEFTSSAPIGTFTDGRNRAAVREFSAATRVLIAPGLYASVAAGGSSIRGNEIRPIYNASVEGSPQDRWRVSLGVDRDYVKVTPRAIDQGVYSDGATGEVAYWFDSRTSASARLGSRWWSDANRSLASEGSLSRNWIYGRAFNLDGGAVAAHQAFERDMLTISGFFTPDRYSRYAGFANAHGEAFQTLTWELRGEGGSQQITSASDFRPNWSVTARMSVKLAEKLSLYGSYERKNYSLVARNGWYQGFFVSLRVRK